MPAKVYWVQSVLGPECPYTG